MTVYDNRYGRKGWIPIDFVTLWRTVLWWLQQIDTLLVIPL